MTDRMQPPDRPQRYDAQGRRLCTARSRSTKEPCNAPAVTGMYVCRLHGGSAPQTKNKARVRLLELVDPAIGTLAREMLKASSSADRQKAANSILDRAGYGRVSKVETTDARELLVQRLIELQAEAVVEAAADDDYEIPEDTMIDSVIKPCPECQQGKHENCNGVTWDMVLDEEAVCPCNDAAHADA